jgi:uncharacterized protein (DUF1697 family)
MAVVISLLRGVNVGGHNRIRMDALRDLCESLNLREPRTYLQSGNVVLRSDDRNPDLLAKRIREAIGKKLGCRPDVIVRTLLEMREVVARNPFAHRPDVPPQKLLVTFLAGDPSQAARRRILAVRCEPEEVRLEGREVYIYYPNGMGRPELPWTSVEKMLETTGTGRNWTTVTRLLELAERMAPSPAAESQQRR